MFETPHRLHPAAIIIKFGTYFVSTFRAMLAPAIGVAVSAKDAGPARIVFGITLMFAFIGAVSLIGPILHYFSTRFYIQNDALEITSGFVWRKKRTIPLARIQNVNVERTLWHRILNAAAVKVETAAGGKSEGDLAALSLADANKLQAVLLHNRVEEAVHAEAVEKPLYELSTKQVLLAGALGNRAAYIFASVMAVLQFEGAHRFYKPAFEYVEHLGPVMASILGALSVVVLIFVGWLVSIGISATRFYGFRIEKHDRGLLLAHGLITQFRNVVPVGRVQDVRVYEPILFRLFGYCEVYADTAGSFDVKDAATANMICPILPDTDVDRIGRLLMPDFEFQGLSWRQVSRKTVLRYTWRHFWVLALFVVVPLAFWIKWFALIVVPPLFVYCLVMGLINYRYVGYSFTDDVLAARRGVFRRQATVIPFDRIQHYTISTSLTQRWMGLATVTAISAATGGHMIHIADVERETAEHLSRTIGAAIQRHMGSRRGGL